MRGIILPSFFCQNYHYMVIYTYANINKQIVIKEVKMTQEPKYPGRSGNFCKGCQYPIAEDGNCGCKDPRWNHIDKKIVDPMDLTQILIAPTLTEEEKKLLLDE